jgi:osmotically-inducible protein OsmY
MRHDKRKTITSARVRWFALPVLGLLLASFAALPIQAAEPSQDADITTWVKDSLRNDPRVGSAAIEVTTDQGVVTLSGEVDSLASKRYAKLETTKIKGVVGLIDEITVEPQFRSDTDIRNAVRRRILNSPVIDSENVSVTVLSGQVTLRGEVSSWSEREEAELLASEVGGVKRVKNEITTRWSKSRPDQEIKNDAVGTLDRDVYLTSLPIAVSVEDGVVTLEGNVGNLYEKNRAFNDIRWIRNVKSVNNDLAIEPWKSEGTRRAAAAPTDSELSESLREALMLDPRVKSTEITVQASHGHVTLDGTVKTHYEKRVAEQDARDVVGVGWVTNNLFARVDRREDWAIKDDVKFNFDTDYALEGFDLGVGVTNGAVSLSGTVHTWYQKYHARDVASRVRGVRNVFNHIVVDRNNWKLDAEVVESINNRLKWNWTTYWVHDDVGVTATNGVVTLNGDVNTWAERKEAGRVALETSGVWEVDNRITVKGHDYPWDEWHYRGSRFRDRQGSFRDHGSYFDDEPYWWDDE